MSDPAAAVRGLLADIERAASAFETVCGEIRGEIAQQAEQTDARVREAQRDRDAVREAEQGARTRAKQAEQATAILREEREVIRQALRAVTGAGDSSENGSR
ncbi:hypothetical protein GBAR_LOCUS1395 [Geodia barretti]|uniref:Uncharacterized protein n=1 Tax=Geodia barretti TaxID=519541 RepID=A0AA35W0P8_GEOBA|nr:hypothetical protein GBAR_LOCUS1395 [Geodia barretti]